MGGVCSTYEGQDRDKHDFGEGTSLERDHLDDLGVDGRIILK